MSHSQTLHNHSYKANNINSADSIVSSGSPGRFSMIQFRLVQIMITIALILSIAGGTSSITPQGTYEPQATSKAGVVLYLIALLALGIIAIITAMKLSNSPKDYTRIAWVTILALPFIFIRLLYSFLAVFSSNNNFSPASGSVIIHVFMAILEEFIVVLMYLVIGWMTDALAPATRGSNASQPWKGNLAGRGAQDGNGRSRRQGPIHALVNAGIARTQQRQQEAEQGNTTRQTV